MNRLKILSFLTNKGGCGECSDLHEVVDLAQPSISHHVKILSDCGLIDGAKEGRNLRYTLNQEVLAEYIKGLEGLRC